MWMRVVTGHNTRNYRYDGYVIYRSTERDVRPAISIIPELERNELGAGAAGTGRGRKGSGASGDGCITRTSTGGTMGLALHSLVRMTGGRCGSFGTELIYGVPGCAGGGVEWWLAGGGALISSRGAAAHSFSSPDGSACLCTGIGSPFATRADIGAERIEKSAVAPSGSGNVGCCGAVEIVDPCEDGEGGDVGTGEEQ